MARRPLTDEQIKDFRDSFCQHAYALYKVSGYGAVSMRKIAGSMQCSPMLAYRYFENKEEVFAALREHLFHRLADKLETLPPSQSPLQNLQLICNAYVQFALEEPQAYRLLYVNEIAIDAHYDNVGKAQGRTRKVLLNATQEAIESGLLKGEPSLVAHGLWAMIHGLLTLHLANQLNQGASFEELYPTILQPFLNN